MKEINSKLNIQTKQFASGFAFKLLTSSGLLIEWIDKYKKFDEEIKNFYQNIKGPIILDSKMRKEEKEPKKKIIKVLQEETNKLIDNFLKLKPRIELLNYKKDNKDFEDIKMESKSISKDASTTNLNKDSNRQAFEQLSLKEKFSSLTQINNKGKKLKEIVCLHTTLKQKLEEFLEKFNYHHKDLLLSI